MPEDFTLLRDKINVHNLNLSYRSPALTDFYTMRFKMPIHRQAFRWLLNVVIMLIMIHCFKSYKSKIYFRHCAGTFRSIHYLPKSFTTVKIQTTTEPTESTTTTTAAPTTRKTKMKVNRDAMLWEGSFAMDSMALFNADPNPVGYVEYINKKADVLETSGDFMRMETTNSKKAANLSITDNLICCYEDPNSFGNENERRVGRPFIRNEQIDKYWFQYMNSIKSELRNTNSKSNIVPQLVTAVSENHFTEHKEHMDQVRKHYPGQKVVIYDLGLTHEQCC